jgi:hypothetical protein
VPSANGQIAEPVGPIMVPAESVPDRRGVVACMAHSVRSSKWVLPRLFRAVAILGEVTIDLTRVQIGPGVSEIEVLAIMGQVNIIVPHNLNVECDGDSVMGEFRVRKDSDGIPVPEAPAVRIRGSVYMGNVKVRIVDPNVPNWRDQWRAARAAKRLANVQLKEQKKESKRDRLGR